MFAKNDSNLSDNGGNRNDLYAGAKPRDVLYGMAENLTKATYLVTSLFSDKEPLKWHLRKKVLEILQGSVSYSKGASVERQMRTVLEEVMSLIDTAALAGLISTMNRDVLLREFKHFLEQISIKDLSREAVSAGIRKLFIESAGAAKETQTMLAPKSLSVKFKGTPGGKRQRFVVRDNQAKTFDKRQNGNGGNSERKESILKVIRDKGEVTIKDIASVVPGYSEKTIQRDLIDLLSGGSLKKKGERRWTVYFLP